MHATAVALGDKAALIRGPSGSGKSDLALRCIAAPPLPGRDCRAELVADDQLRIARTDDVIRIRPPSTIAGKMEVRGVGILTVPYRPEARLVLVVDLVSRDEVPRYPLETPTAEFLGLSVPVVRLSAFEASAPIKLLMALNAAGDVLTPP
ncbi:MAG TPA: HPr kinase/phosphatase C-terminal domain-containing protein [Allosphingosinicella sp.]|nr:HPr kinase/phosphatase C-terminal domain-containing protein [Allosphingosinicella sp.]